MRIAAYAIERWPNRRSCLPSPGTPVDFAAARYLSVFATAFLLATSACSGDSGASDIPDDDVDGADADAGGDAASDSDASGRDASDGGESPDALPDGGEPDGPEEIICRECERNEDCGGEPNLCLSFPAGGAWCGYDCVDDETICPEGTTCVNVDDTGTVRQCVPDTLSCVDLCAGVECPEGEVCDPLDGNCMVPLGLCDECVTNQQCGGPNDLCLQFADIDNRTGCALDCSVNPSGCPEGYFCTDLTTPEGPASQCVPESGTCVDRCVDVTCEIEGELCNPRTGECFTPGGLCAPCVANLECGGEFDQCIGLPGPDCITDEDCGADEFCNEEQGFCVGAACGLDCSADPTLCPEGSGCFNLTGGAQQCLPLRLTCTDRCADVICEAGQNCDDRSGECIDAVVSACGAPCESHAECGEYDDFCLAVTGRAFCAYQCGDVFEPCPVGYECLTVFTGMSFCLANNAEFECNDCNTMACPEGEECYPFDASCYPRPSECSFEDESCDDGEICNPFEGRCEPVGQPCDQEHAFFSCDLSILSCSAATAVLPGQCEERCFGPGNCPADRAACVDYHGVTGQVCVSDPVGGAHTCGALMPTTSAIGLPCVVDDDPTDPAICPVPGAEYCLEGIDPSVGGFCTTDCESDDECDTGTCAEVADGSWCVPAECGCLLPAELEPGEVDVFADVLGLAGTSRCDVAWSLAERRAAYPVIEVDDAYRLTGASPALGDPIAGLDIAATARAALREARTTSTSAIPALAFAAAARGGGLRSGTAPEPGAGENPLFDQLVSIQDRFSAPAPSSEVADEALALPDAVAAEVAGVVGALLDAFEAHEVAFDGVSNETMQRAYASLHTAVYAGAGDIALSDPEIRGIASSQSRQIDLLNLAATVVRAAEGFPTGFEDDLSEVSFAFESDLGWVVIAGSGDDTHTWDRPVLLLVDLGGDDTYRFPAGANASADEPISLVIDLDGADEYGYAPIADPADEGFLPSDGAGRGEPVRLGDGPVSLSSTARQGAGLFGVGALYDRGGGEDVYRSLRMSQGFGMVGVGVLVDDGADAADLEVEALGQGAGLFGTGVLVLGDAGSTLTGVHGVQGFGGPAGVGVLVGGNGNDSYVASPGDPAEGTVLYFNRLTSVDRNLSAAQGAGLGWPADSTPDARSASGGIGFLYEPGGADSYEAGVGAQGFGHWHGAGMLRDEAGADTYNAHGIAMGAANRFGNGTLVDRAGADRYGTADVRPADSLGHGADFGGGVFVDIEGDDVYLAGTFSVGLGRLNGAGVFLDQEGDDAYDASSNDTLGRAVLTIFGSEPSDNPRREIGTWGLFVDSDGTDAYSRPDLLSPPVGEGLSWIQTSRDEDGLPTYGAGLDALGATGIDP